MDYFAEVVNSEGVVTRTQQLPRLNTWHRELMRRLLLGERVADLAKLFGVSENAIYSVRKSPLFQHEMARLQEQLDARFCDAVTELRLMQPDAIEALRDSVRMVEHPELRLKAALEIFDRTGVSKMSVSRVDISKTVRTYEERLHIIQQGGELPEHERFVDVPEYEEPKILSGTELTDSDPDSK